MSIDSISSTHASGRAHLQQIRQDLNTLQSDLKSGNLAQAQTDFATLLDDAPALKSQLSSAGSPTNASGQTSPLGVLSTALQKGDVSGASTALTSLQQSLRGLHHHHHHHHDGDENAAGGAGSTATDMQSLAGALQSGNLTAAQQAFTQLQADDPRLANALGAATNTAGGVS
ncbi:MAG TPA: hypothetical protein VHE61_10725 [Opitutaceae bacterium]|nr:hypothetical protein [Opitutaceae bacterium]